MFVLIGLGIVLGCVFGAFAASGGAIGPLFASMPFELLTILGAAIGSFLMANPMGVVKHALHDVKKALKGSRYTQEDYLELLGVLFHLCKVASARGMAAVESHIEEPKQSNIFRAHQRVAENEDVCVFVCDYLRMAGMNATDPYQMDDVMGGELRKRALEEAHMAHALQSLADALPALGIVAAVLGVIKTMAAISKPPAVLGEMIAGALVGTFLGILMAYGMVAPIAGRLKSVVEEEGAYLNVVRAMLVAHLQANAPQVSVEIARKSIPSALMPSFKDVEDAVSKPLPAG
ncbi:flagellar motor protein MotA [Neokomagataea thailandica NBRC 106555]|uniref:Flagellar motor stator protein MotA n=2 Tax=Neokomagataea TaxID=1223423 RepID=A0A4Y6V559_9PROT|nr:MULTISPECIES: flagellar motor stator protein MotA [Neokomagataea]QDH24018.1 flagellar motor stator protein MotA [Neokomagataea tanensis]GBR52298.1 flagellar motor protein MotA [Neokomagataea thailandica NBRC 106555]